MQQTLWLRRLELPETATQLFLIRHGRTQWNVERRLQGHTDIPLDEVGRKQAQLVAQRFQQAGIALAAIYSSDLQRARDTALPLSKRLGLPLAVDPRLRERGLGEAEGLNLEEIIARYGEQYDIDRVPGVEPRQALVDRVHAALREFSERYRGQSVAVFSHGAAIANWAWFTLQLPERPRIDNGEGLIVHAEQNGRWRSLDHAFALE